MNIAILAYLEPGEKTPDVVMNQVAEALTAAGHSTSILTSRDDVAQLVQVVRDAKPDLVFNLLESFNNDMIGGSMGVAGVLDLLQVPYTGGGPGEIYLQEDKSLAKKLLDFEDVKYPDFASFTPNADFETGGNLRMPLFVKPQRMEASQGIDEKSLVHSTQELMERVLKIHKTIGDAALAEEYIEGRELYVGVLGNGQPVAFPPIELDFSGLPEGAPKVADRAAKWDETSDRFKGTKSVVANLPSDLRARVQKVAIDAYRAVRVRDYGRVDIRVTEGGEIYVIEVNASCYLEKSSEFAMAAKEQGLEYNDLINRIADLALERFKTRDPRRKKRRK
ncbi:MAG TPA: ATP-grasp domain-containing protein [Caulifigura sp.]|nr:ATP-grasp domain-containing protein [Caulifigura sp.]